MTLEEAQAKIARLERELAKAQGKNNKRDNVPIAFLERHPIIGIKSIESQQIRNIIIHILFKESMHETETSKKMRQYQEERGRLIRNPIYRYIGLDDMSEEQYKVFMETFENILRALIDGRSKAISLSASDSAERAEHGYPLVAQNATIE